MRWLVVFVVVAAGCAHAGIRKVSDCDQVQGEERIECAACVARNEAQGWLGTYEYLPREKSGERCVRAK